MAVKEYITGHGGWEDKLHLLAAIVHDSNDAITVQDFEGNISLWNLGAERIYGYSKAEALKMNVRQIIPESRRAEMLTLTKRLRKGEDIQSFETQRVAKDGQILEILLTITILTDDAGKPISFATTERDITERKRLEEEMLEIPMREREQIGREMHDSLGQMLTGIAVKSKGLELKLKSKSSEESADAAEICRLANRLIAQTRRLAKKLNPVDLGAGGLVSALRALASKTESLFRVSCEVRCEKVASIQDPTMAKHLYHIAQEAVTNAAKHGKAKNIWIELASDEEKSVLTVKNDGKSFPKVLRNKEGLGLKIMDYRARTIGGSLHVRGSPEGGTVATVVFPHRVTNSGKGGHYGRKKAAK
ncbi:MAG: PAS domain-containing sensor histidine kinase [Planctomycetota bacterium]|jgi:PAS domain S-box-containing protein